MTIIEDVKIRKVPDTYFEYRYVDPEPIYPLRCVKNYDEVVSRMEDKIETVKGYRLAYPVIGTTNDLGVTLGARKKVQDILRLPLECIENQAYAILERESEIDMLRVKLKKAEHKIVAQDLKIIGYERNFETLKSSFWKRLKFLFKKCV